MGCDSSVVSFALNFSVFQSTHPRGVRPPDLSACIARKDFNPRTHVGCDLAGVHSPPHALYFNPRTHVGCDIICEKILPNVKISIHAPTWGATNNDSVPKVVDKISIHAPTWGATTFPGPLKTLLFISIHAPTWGATGRIRQEVFGEKAFQSTHPRGVRLLSHQMIGF